MCLLRTLRAEGGKKYPKKTNLCCLSSCWPCEFLQAPIPSAAMQDNQNDDKGSPRPAMAGDRNSISLFGAANDS